MARKSKTRRKKSTRSGSQQRGSTRTLTTLLIVALLVAAGYYMVTGSDPLGLFTDPQPTVISGGDGEWWQIHFTDPENHNDPDNLSGTVAAALIDHINDAQRSIHVAAFEFDLPTVAEALIAAEERGVQVYWVTDDEYGILEDEEEGLALFALLERAGVEVRDDGRSALMHHKFWIFDDQTLWTGSTNVTQNGILRNNNNNIVFSIPQLAAIYATEFDEMWAGEFGVRSPSTVDDQKLTVDDTPIQVLFAPEDEVARQLVPLIENAQSRIRFMAFAFTHDEIGDAVLARAEAGVDVMGIFETRGSETEFSQFPRLYCAGIPVRQDGNPGTFHHKVFVIDDETVVTGSYNFTANADENNEENAIMITNAEIASHYLLEFERRWTEARVEPPDVSCR